MVNKTLVLVVGIVEVGVSGAGAGPGEAGRTRPGLAEGEEEGGAGAGGGGEQHLGAARRHRLGEGAGQPQRRVHQLLGAEDEDAAASIGIHATREKLRVTLISAALAGLAGALTA